ncbi:MAG: trigger factor [Lutibacter sp.]|uniref:trigger factor n=1 Tax=Lutibacter sp. TaxID=1925666 RepID=UPI00299D95E3|nr:trigger factor [Lutibacter sp.]MDX1828706.1 trigger factor [Lutibacter sp.]
MNITKENIDELNAVVKVEIAAADYQDKVSEILKDYRKKADIPGFRKGQVPMGMVEKQYGKSVMIDEVNKLLQDSLNKFLTEEKIDILGNPLPKMQDDFNWDAGDYAFEFELGLAPVIEIDLKAKNKINQYKIVADDKLIEEEVEKIRKQFGKLVSKSEVEEGVTLTGTFVNEEKEINKKSTIEFASIKGKTNQKKFLGSKVGDVLILKSKGLFDDDHKLMGALGLSHDDIHGLDIALTFTIEEINVTELAEMNQELFDKVFGKDVVKTEEELKAKIKEEIEKQFQAQADQQIINDVNEYLVENTKFELPAEFLKKWIVVSGEKPLTPEQAAEEYEKSEKGLRFQLIQDKIFKDNNLQITFEELKEYTKGFVVAQMAQYGQLNPEEKQLDEIVQRVLTNEEEVKRLQDQLMGQKLLDFYKANVSFKVKEVNYEEFVKEVYK